MTGIGMSPDTACVEKFVGSTKDHGNNRWLMSALPPKPESRHLDMFDVRFCPRKRTNSRHLGMSALCHERPNALQQIALLFNHLVGAGEHCPWDRQTERLRRLEVDYQPKFGRLLHRQVARLRPS